MAKITDDKEHSAMRNVQASDIMKEIGHQREAVQDLIRERRQRIQDAYLLLPDVARFGEGCEYRVICAPENERVLKIVQKIEDVPEYDTYVFFRREGRWVMATEEYNRHVYKGVYL